MADPRFMKFNTRALHAGQRPDPETGSRAVPIHQTTSYVFRNTDHAAALFNLERAGHIYSRISFTEHQGNLVQLQSLWRLVQRHYQWTIRNGTFTAHFPANKHDPRFH